MAELLLSDAADGLAASFKQVRSVDRLAGILKLRPDQLRHYAYGRGRRYRHFQVAKRRGGERRILEPAAGLKAVQQKLTQVLSAVFTPSDCVHGFTKRRSIATNAFAHVGRNWVLNVDLKDFFPSINFGRVRGLLMARPYVLPGNVATVIAQICTFQNELPQGAPTSPVISNMIAARMDAELARLARRYKCTYTRYADDLTFSRTGTSFPEALGVWGPIDEAVPSTVGSALRLVIERNGFEANEEKVRLQSSNERQIVTGLIVNEVVNVPRRFVRRIRAMLHAWEVYGPEKAGLEHFARYDTKDRGHGLPEFRQIVKGHIDFLGMVRGTDHKWYQKLVAQYAKLDLDYNVRPVKLRRPNHLRSWRDAIWVIEWSKEIREELLVKQGTAFELKGYGLVTCSHVLPEDVGDVYVYHPRNEHVRYPVRLVVKDEVRDVAILTFEAPSGCALEPGPILELRPTSGIIAAGYPNHAPGASLWEDTGTITTVRRFMSMPRYIVSFPIRSGASGAPFMDRQRRVIGIAATGVQSFKEASGDPKDYGVIPISVLAEVRAGSFGDPGQ